MVIRVVQFVAVPSLLHVAFQHLIQQVLVVVHVMWMIHEGVPVRRCIIVIVIARFGTLAAVTQKVGVTRNPVRFDFRELDFGTTEGAAPIILEPQVDTELTKGLVAARMDLDDVGKGYRLVTNAAINIIDVFALIGF
jgi:hypothetical protein